MDNERSGWTWSQRLSLVSGGVAAIAVVLVLTVAPVRAWAESLLSVFRVQRVTVLEIDPATIKNNGLENNQLLNQAISRVLSDEVTVTQKPQRPQLITDAALASNDAGFTVRLLPDKTPSSLLLESGAAMQMKLNRDRIQSILNEAGRSDLQIPEVSRRCYCRGARTGRSDGVLWQLRRCGFANDESGSVPTWTQRCSATRSARRRHLRFGDPNSQPDRIRSSTDRSCPDRAGCAAVSRDERQRCRQFHADCRLDLNAGAAGRPWPVEIRAGARQRQRSCAVAADKSAAI